MGHDRESDPSADFVSVIRARDKVEESRERVPSREGNFPHFCSRRPQITQSDVNAQIAQLAQGEDAQTGVDLGLSG